MDSKICPSSCKEHLYRCKRGGGLPVLKVSQVAARLCVGHQTVLGWIVRGVGSPGGVRRLMASRAGRSWRISEEDLEKFVLASEEVVPIKAPSSTKEQKKIASEVKEYWGVMNRKKK